MQQDIIELDEAALGQVAGGANNTIDPNGSDATNVIDPNGKA